MSEFKNVWQPVTEEYKTVEAPPVVVPVEPPKELVASQQARADERWKGKKAPIAITVFIWYLFARAGIYALLLFILAAFPQSSASAWLADSVANFLHLPSVAERDAAREYQLQSQTPANGDANPSSSDGQNAADDQQSSTRERVMVYLFIAMVTTTVVGFMWLLRSWKIRWITMFYAGAFVAKIGINYFAGIASGVGSQLPPGEIPILMFSLALNLFVFLYLAFWPDVKDYFEELA
jgi:hypothetical protein